MKYCQPSQCLLVGLHLLFHILHFYYQTPPHQNTPNPFSLPAVMSVAAAAAESKQTAIISFSNIWKRREVYSRKTQLRDTQVFISEDLPKEESALLFECRKLRRERLIKTCYSKDLAVFIRTNLGSEVQITSKSDLQKYSTDSTPARSSTPLGPVNISDHSVETSSMYMYSASQLPDNSIDEEETFYGFGEEQMRT